MPHSGRNVCLHYLVGSCKFGDLKCIYSHSKDFLPKNGWWKTDEGRRNCREKMDLEKEDRKATRHFNHIFGEYLYKSGISFRMSDSSGGRKGKVPAGATPRNAKKQMLNKTAADPFVLLLSLGYADMFNSIHGHFLTALRSRAKVGQADTKESALQNLARPDLIGVFVTDPAITDKKYANVLSRLVEYAKTGGTVVIGGTFSTFVRGADNDAFFKKAWGLNWKTGSYHRTTFSLNPSRPERLSEGPSLASSYSMKTVHLKGISPETVVYGPTATSRTQSMVFAPSAVDLSEAPVVYSPMGQGFLGYIGDVNGEKDSTNVILSMLGLPAQTKKSSEVKVGPKERGETGMKGRMGSWTKG